ncbi:uncharacterized protein JCM15063_002687 [Sporobolomyces koalae]|uniref:uncharacterized protein n=1 Tax=Sporobolomyces koalae TaxID=500713 RepID=UPI00318007EB
MQGTLPRQSSSGVVYRLITRKCADEPSVEAVTLLPTASILVSPWIWLTVSTLALLGLLFVSFRRARAVELYQRARESVSSKLSTLPPIRLSLSLDRSTGSGSSGPPRFTRSLSTDSDLSSAPLDAEDELPFDTLPLTRSARLGSWQRRSRSMLENLQSNVWHASHNLVESLGWHSGSSSDQRSSGGIKQILLGTRDVDKSMGRIRLESGTTAWSIGELEGDEDATDLTTLPDKQSPSRGLPR